MISFTWLISSRDERKTVSSRDEMNVESYFGVFGQHLRTIMVFSRGKKYILLASSNVMLGSASVLLQMQSILLLCIYNINSKQLFFIAW